MLKTGQKELHDGAKDEMAQALRAMGQAARMTKDPTFQEQPDGADGQRVQVAAVGDGAAAAGRRAAMLAGCGG